MQGNRFDFLEQHHLIDDLLNVCCDTMPHLPPVLWARMMAAMSPFMVFAVPVLWGLGDADQDNLGLTNEEKAEVLRRFVCTYECNEADWEALRQISQDVLRERKRWLDATGVCKRFFEGLAMKGGFGCSREAMI